MKIPEKYIETLTILVKYKSFKKSQDILQMHPTTMRRHIKSIENLIGEKILEKNDKGLYEVTEKGIKLLESSETKTNKIFINNSFLSPLIINNTQVEISINPYEWDQFVSLNIPIDYRNYPRSDSYLQLGLYINYKFIEDNLNISNYQFLVYREISSILFPFLKKNSINYIIFDDLFTGILLSQQQKSIIILYKNNFFHQYFNFFHINDNNFNYTIPIFTISLK